MKEVEILWGVDENGKPLVTYDGLDGDSRPEVIERILASRNLVNQKMSVISIVEIREKIMWL